MKEIIKQVLEENLVEPRRIVGMSHVDQQDFKTWKRHGLRPFVINDDAKFGISFEEIEFSDLKPMLQRQGDKQAIYLLEEQQVRMAQRFAEPIMQIINLKRKSIETTKQLFEAVLVQKFMKNEFGKMADHHDSDDVINSRNENVAKARQLLNTLDGTMRQGGYSNDDVIQQALDAVDNSGLDWDNLPSSIRDRHTKLTTKARQHIR
jgi:hypothetical protein